MTQIRKLRTITERVERILDEAVGRDLSQWEKDRLNEWRTLAFGSAKQLAVVDNIGRRLLGDDEWDGFIVVDNAVGEG